MKVIVLNNQSFFDLAIRYCGTALTAFEISKVNAIAVTKDLVPGEEIEIPEELIMNKEIVSYFESRNHQPATAWHGDRATEVQLLEGISYWTVNLDFVVS